MAAQLIFSSPMPGWRSVVEWRGWGSGAGPGTPWSRVVSCSEYPYGGGELGRATTQLESARARSIINESLMLSILSGLASEA